MSTSRFVSMSFLCSWACRIRIIYYFQTNECSENLIREWCIKRTWINISENGEVYYDKIFWLSNRTQTQPSAWISEFIFGILRVGFEEKGEIILVLNCSLFKTSSKTHQTVTSIFTSSLERHWILFAT
jgi:hypothetical protein